MNPVGECHVLVTNLMHLIGLPGPPAPFSVLVGTPPMPSSPSISTPVVEIPPGRPWDLTSQADTQRAMMQLRSGVSTLWGAPWPAGNKRQGEQLDKFPLSSLLGELLQRAVSPCKHHELSKPPVRRPSLCSRLL